MEKIYYTIGEVAEMLEESTSLVRYWSDVFSDFIRPVRNKKGNRLYTQEDLANIRIVYHLVKVRRLTLEGALRRMKDNREGLDRSVAITESLTRIKEALLEVKESL